MRKFIDGFVYAYRGIVAVFREELNFRIHTTIALCVVVLGFVLSVSPTEWVALLICMGIVFAAEIFNTAIERMVDYISTEQHPLAGRIKDMSAGAVLVVAFFSFVVGVVVFAPKLIALL